MGSGHNSALVQGERRNGVERTREKKKEKYLKRTNEREKKRNYLCVRVLGSTATLWHGPVNVLARILDIAGLAVNAVLRVDLEALGASGSRFIINKLVHTGRAETTLRTIIDLQVALNRYILVLEAQVDGLVLGVVGACPRNRGQQIKGNNAVGFWVINLLGIGGNTETLVVGCGVVEGPGGSALEENGVDTRVENSSKVAERGVETGSAVTDLLQLLPDPAVLDLLLKVLQNNGLALLVLVRGDGSVGRLGSEHSRLHGSVGTLDLDQVQESSGASNQGTSGEVQLGNRLKTSLVNGTGTIGQALASLQKILDVGMVLPALELLVGVEVRVLIVETDDETQAEHIFAHVVNKRSSVGRVVDGPAHGVDNSSWLGFFGVNLPDFLDSDTVGLGVALVAKVELAEELLGQRAVASFGKESDLGVELHAALELLLGLEILVQSDIVGCDSLDTSILVVKNLYELWIGESDNKAEQVYVSNEEDGHFWRGNESTQF